MRLRAALALVLALAAAAPLRSEPARVVDGGVYRDPGLTAYVGRVGARLVAAAGLPAGAWSFQVLDSPEANAFVLPGREIVITRGMLALVNDEAELAVVLGHEIGHAVAGHGNPGSRPVDRRAAELEADRIGMRLVADAGYDATAQVDFLRTLLASEVLQARIDGADPARAGSGGRDHPALADRLREARQDSADYRSRGARDRGAYLAAIDGMIWGDRPAHGFVSGRTYVHPALRFAFDAPRGYTLVDGRDVVMANGPRDALLLFDSLPDPGGDPARYLVRDWLPEIGQGVATGPVADLQRLRLHGLDAARATVALATPGSRRIAELTVARYRGRLYRLSGLYQPGDTRAARSLSAATASFRPLPPGKAAVPPPLRIRIHRIAAGDDVAAMASEMPVGAGSRARFDLMNGLKPGSRLRVGDAVKLVSD
jgi:predicted Zn-dependent protease